MRTLLVAAAAGLLLAEGAAAEVVARGVQDGMLATTRAGRPVVAYIRGPSLAVATRTGAHRWRTVRAAAVTRGSTVASRWRKGRRRTGWRALHVVSTLGAPLLF